MSTAKRVSLTSRNTMEVDIANVIRDKIICFRSHWRLVVELGLNLVASRFLTPELSSFPGTDK